MTTEPASESKRPHPVLLVLLGLVVVAAVAIKLMGSASPGTAASNRSGPRHKPHGRHAVGVTIDRSVCARRAPRRAGGRADGGAEPSAIPSLQTGAGPRHHLWRPAAPSPNVPPAPVGPPPPPPPPPITVKFIGILDLADGTRIAVFTDCSAGRRQAQAREGGTVDGRYRLVKIGRESVVIEHLDGRGRTTLAAGGQECVAK